MRRGARGLVAGAFAVLAIATTTPSQAKPLWNAGWETGLCGASSRIGFANPGWCNAAHADVVFLRERGSDLGVGPSLRLGTASFDDFRVDGGVSLLVPVLDWLPLVLEAGPHLHNLKDPGLYGSVFVGIRSFNHYGHYEMAGGLVITAERSFVSGTPSALWITARIDAIWLALPFVAGYNALK